MKNALAATEPEILVVDDDRDTAMMFAQLLEQLGHTVRYVTDPHAVVELAKRTRPRLIFLDIGMPALDGWQLAPLLKSELGHEAVRLVAVSGFGAPEHHRRSREAGFDAHVQKPIDVLLLQSILKQLRS